jgi:hypothetical protein
MNGRQHLHERVLRDVHGRGAVAGIAQRNGINPVLVGFEQDTKGIRIPALAGFDHLPVVCIQHYTQATTLDDCRLRFLPGKLQVYRDTPDGATIGT